jgi:predicted outer membrane protein
MKQTPPIIEPIEADAFIASVTREFTADMQLAELALTRATTDPVRTMATHISYDCDRALLDIARISTRKNLPLTEPSDTHQESLLKCMRALAGVDFDYVYIERVAMHHRLEVKLLKRGLAIKIPAISALASRLLAVVEARVKLSRHLSGRIESLIGDEARGPSASNPSGL